MSEVKNKKILNNDLTSGSGSMDSISRLKNEVKKARFLSSFSQNRTSDIRKMKKDIARQLTLGKNS